MRPEIFEKLLRTETFEDFLDCFSGGCTRCSLYTQNKFPVIYRGNPKAKIMLLGEALGKEERRQGKPFVGPSGQLLDKIFKNIVGLDTNKDMILGNIIMCQPVAPYGSGRQNNPPKPDQIKACSPMVRKLISIVNPTTLICCGLPAAKTILSLPNTSRMRDLEGKWYKDAEIPTFVMRHPSSLLRLSAYPKEEKKAKLTVQRYMFYFKDTYPK